MTEDKKSDSAGREVNTTPSDVPDKRRWLRFWGVVALAVVATIFGLALLVNIFQRKQEARNPFFRVVELTDDTVDPAVWGKNFPLQYDDYLKTTDQIRTRYGGSEAEPRTPTQADPRSIVAQSRLEEDPRLKLMWAGYAFSRDFREERGHAYMLEDQMFTERQQVTKQPGTCINCHASVYAAYKQLGGGDIFKGFDELNRTPYFEARKMVTHPVGCIDCHDSQTMQLRVTRPAFIEGMRALKASQGIQNYDVNKQATRQEMRAFVCGQCHDEYHFSGPEKRLVYPWAKGLQVENILAFYDEQKFKDWEHADTGAPVLKAQHPEFDIKTAKGAGRTDIAVTTAQDFQRRAQFYLDFIESENSNGFHAPQEATRILGESINFSRKGQVALRGGVQPTTTGPVAMSRVTP